MDTIQEEYIGVSIPDLDHKLNLAAGHSHFDEKTLPVIKTELAKAGWNNCAIINEVHGGVTYYWYKDNSWYRLNGDYANDKIWLEKIYFTP
jgi:hypothetical protein